MTAAPLLPSGYASAGGRKSTRTECAARAAQDSASAQAPSVTPVPSAARATTSGTSAQSADATFDDHGPTRYSSSPRASKATTWLRRQSPDQAGFVRAATRKWYRTPGLRSATSCAKCAPTAREPKTGSDGSDAFTARPA